MSTGGSTQTGGATELPSRPRGGGRGRGQGRSQGRGPRGGDSSNGETAQREYRGQQRGSRGGGQNQNRGARGVTESQNQGQRMGSAAVLANLNPALRPANATGLTARYQNPEAAQREEGQVVEDVDAEVCFICASEVTHESIAPCNHRTCHICCLRMRALYKDLNCAHCRTPAPFVIFTDDKTKRFEDFTEADTPRVDNINGIRYESSEIEDDSRLLLRFNCPDGDCDVACISWPDLHRHARSIHKKKICDLCSKHKKIFTHEHELFTDAELSRHMKKGDDSPGAVDQSGFKGHPLCSFCGTRFYSDDELYVHCREAHERCHVCDAVSGGVPQYFLNYDAVYAHMVKDHFVCREPECLEKKFVAFGSEMDLKAHQLSEHGNSLSKDVRRDARVVDISSFDYRAPYAQERRGGGSQREQREGRGRGRGRGRDPNADAIPASSAQPLRRDEQAFQRQMAIQSAQSITPRTFGGQLTPNSTPAQSRVGPVAMAIQQPSTNVIAATSTPQVPPPSLTPQDQARKLRHGAVVERASGLLHKDEAKLTQFRNLISLFQKNDIAAPALIDSFFTLFSETTPTALGTLIREVADLFEDPNKAGAIRAAWSNWRAINDDYPSLPAASSNSSSAIPLNWAVTSSGSSSAAKPKASRVLKLKSSTAQSSRSSVSQNRSWGTASNASSSSATTSSTPFPGLPSPASRPSAPAGKISTVSWVASSSASNSAPGSVQPTPPSSRPASRNVGKDSSAFPALPPAAKPQSSIFGYGKGMVKRDNGLGTTTNAWAADASASSSLENNGMEESEDLGGKGKGKKKGKKLLVAWG
ncbi:zinc finger protein [Diplocarpon rosae]|nr:zinc finger protein [Diplocarpon rosae]